MKTTQIFGIMKRSRSIGLVKFADEQWVTDQRAIYNISALPEFEPEQFLTAIGVEEKKKGEYRIEYMPQLERIIMSLKDSSSGRLINRFSTAIVHLGAEYEPCIAFNKVHFINTAYLKPFRGMEYELYCHPDPASDSCIFSVRAGFLLLGAILPLADISPEVKQELAIITETLKLMDTYAAEEAAAAEDDIDEEDVPY